MKRLALALVAVATFTGCATDDSGDIRMIEECDARGGEPHYSSVGMFNTYEYHWCEGDGQP